MLHGRNFFSFFVVLSLVFCFVNVTFSEDRLKIGSVAPPLKIENWISGQFNRITDFESGKVYVIEFWSTRCVPCIASMPHLKKIQNQFKNQGVRVISVSDEDLGIVQSFLKRKLSNSDTTYRELTSSYSLTTDPDKSTHNDYLAASGQNEIPVAFIVGKSGKIEWMGHPMNLEPPLEAVIDDEWDYVAHAKQQAIDKKATHAINGSMGQAVAYQNQGKIKNALQITDSLIKKFPNASLIKDVKGFRLELLLSEGSEKSSGAIQELAASLKQADLLNQVGVVVYQMKLKGAPVPDSAIAAAIKVLKNSLTSFPKNLQIMDTLAHLYYLDGQLGNAIETQEIAVENSGKLRSQLEPFLRQLIEEQKSASKK